MTEKYDPTNEQHKQIKFSIEKGDGIPNLNTLDEISAYIKGAGFIVQELTDYAEMNSNQAPWYQPLKATFSISGLRRTNFGRYMTATALWWAETFHMVPKNTYLVQQILEEAATSLVAGGETGTFSPLMLTIAQKPMN
jgi:sterol 24-C-methyltransferase